jgi:diaminohydroxyphosphoribosylaminopyrimidine deaminase/5-amino-6-(5-phosphoribosylamino)uracil reductase
LTKPENVLRLQHWEEAGVEVLAIEGEDFVAGVLDLLGSRQMTNILVEGGAGLLGSFHDSNAIDEAWVFVAPLLIGGSKALSPLGGTGAMSLAEALRFPNVETQSFGRDVLIRCWRNAIRAE